MTVPDDRGIEVPAALAGERVDRIVAMLVPCSRAEAGRLVIAGGVLVGGQPARAASRRVALGERIEIDAGAVRPEPTPPPVEEALEPLRLVHVDEDLVIVDKPAGVVVHPGAGHHGATLVSQLLAEFPELANTEGIGDQGRPGIVHRLDKDTSGLLAVARTALAYDSLTGQLADRTMGRSYRALVLGRLGAGSGAVEAPIGRSRRDRTRMAVTRDGREARTRYRVLARYEEPLPLTELDVRLDTGRTHQIRVHLSAIGHPVAGDGRYGGGRSRLGLARPFLHAESLQLTHPRTGSRLTASSLLPPELVEMLARCC